MSLDVYLTGPQPAPTGTGIFIRDNGSVREVSRAEWDERFPGQEPVFAHYHTDDDLLYSANITHNLGQMADKAGLYQPLWRPDENGFVLAAQLIEPLRNGLERLKAEPNRFKKFNPPNGWGDYDGLVAFVEDYLRACEKYPSATVNVWR